LENQTNLLELKEEVELIVMNNPIFNTDLVSIAIRTCKNNNFLLLCQAIESVKNNNYRPIEIIIVAQTMDTNFIKRIQNLVDTYKDKNFQLKLFVNPTNEDQRAKNLNIGINQAKGKYLGFLDDDDIFYPDHLETLISALKANANKYTWAYTDVLVPLCELNDFNGVKIISSDCPYKKEQFFLDAFFQNNFIPIHSYILDREKINSELLQFDETLKVTEDYAFLLKIAALYPPLYISKITCEYRFWTNGSNTNYHVNILVGSDYQSKLNVWNEAAVKIEMLKLQLDQSYQPVSLVSLKTRQNFISNYPYLYKLKYKFPRFWDILVRTAVKLKLVK
jgi:glycosyltransferase involved in cell wall biosynthesis